MINWRSKEKSDGWKNWFITKSTINGRGIVKLGIRVSKLIWEILKWFRTKSNWMEKREKIIIIEFIWKTLWNCNYKG